MLWKPQTSRKNFQDFSPDFENFEALIISKLKPEAEPFALSTPGRVPVPLLIKVKEELFRMEQMQIISRVDDPTEWCTGMVIVPKANGKVRICVDSTNLNESILTEFHPLPSVDHTLAQLAEATVFSKLDTNSAFGQNSLSPESAKLTTIWEVLLQPPTLWHKFYP